jgi:hypothetical protein
MSTSGRGGDALTRAARARGASLKRTRPDYNGLDEDGVLTPLPLTDADYTSAARNVARRFMKDAHGCTGKDCPAPGHAADHGRMSLALWALRLAPDPGTRDGRYDPWGNPKDKSSAGSKPAA